jgi:uncharacterized protein
MLALVVPALVALLAATSAGAQGGDVVISQIYAGGQIRNAPLRSDFVKPFNRGATPVPIDGWSVQHASATGGATSAVLCPRAPRGA